MGRAGPFGLRAPLRSAVARLEWGSRVKFQGWREGVTWEPPRAEEDEEYEEEEEEDDGTAAAAAADAAARARE